MTFVIVVIAVVVVAAVLWFVGRRGAASRKPDESPYHLGLNALIAGERDVAMKHLTRAVREDPRNVDAYVKLGNILRERGQVRQAIQIHRELLVKRKIPATIQSELRKNLARDLAAAGRWREVLEHLSSLPRKERSDPDVVAMTRDAHESAGDYEKAMQAHRDLLKSGAVEGEPSVGVYRAHLGLAALLRGDSRTAKNELQAAVKEDPSASLAYLHLGDIAERMEDTERAVAYWMKLISERPDCAHLVFEKLEKAYFDMGDYGRMMGIYEELVARSPSNVQALTGLARMLERKGSLDEAIRVATEATKHEGENHEGHRQLIEILMRHDRHEEAAKAAESLLEALSDHTEPRICEKCGEPLEEYGWRCGSCRTWLTSGC